MRARPAVRSAGTPASAPDVGAPAAPAPRLPDLRQLRAGRDAPALLTLENAEAVLRRYHHEPPRIADPFTAFPTRGFWLNRMMSEARRH